MQIKAVIFDAGGVLHNDLMPFIKADFRETLEISEEQYQKVWNSVVEVFGSGKMTVSDYDKEFKRLSGSKSDFPASELLGRKYREKYQPNKEVYEVVEALKQEGIKVAVLSNTNSIHAKINEEFKTYEPFPLVILSHEVGLRKPDPKIYKLTLEKLRVKPFEAVFIDDGQVYVEAAKTVGIHGILFKNSAQLKLDLRSLGLKL